MRNAVLATQSEVLTQSNQFNMAATLMAVVVDFSKNMIYYLYIENSTLRYKNNKPRLYIDGERIPVRRNLCCRRMESLRLTQGLQNE
jgi:hypothetical protein